MAVYPDYLKRVPIRTALLFFFIPVTGLAVAITGFCSYLLAVQKLVDNTEVLMGDTVRQTRVLVEGTFSSMLSQLVAFETSHPYLKVLENEAAHKPPERIYDQIIGVNRRLDEMITTYDAVVDSIYVKLGSGLDFSLQKSFAAEDVSTDLNEWFKKPRTGNSEYGWLNAHNDSVFKTAEQRSVLTLYHLVGKQDASLRAVEIVNLRTLYILNLFKDVHISSHGYLVMVSQDGGVLYAKQPDAANRLDQASERVLFSANKEDHAKLRNVRGEALRAYWDIVPVNGWVLAAIVPDRDIREPMYWIGYYSVGIMLLLIAVSAGAAVVFASGITNSIRYLSRQTKRFVLGDLNTDFEIPEANEIGVLSRGLGSMAASVRELLERVRAEQERKRLLEIEALQAQINPHFLYNTLASIRQLVQMKDNERADRMIGALGTFFRIGISRGRDLIHLEEEFAHVESYLVIQNMRYRSRFSYTMDLADDVKECLVPKLTIQPLVENALYHGIRDNNRRGIMKIRAFRESATIVIQVEDDGKGIEAELLKRLLVSISSSRPEEEELSYGLRNVHQRIRLRYGQPWGLGIVSEAGFGCLVTVRYPDQPEQPEEKQE